MNTKELKSKLIGTGNVNNKEEQKLNEGEYRGGGINKTQTQHLKRYVKKKNLVRTPKK